MVDTGVIYAPDAEVGGRMIWDHRHSRLLGFESRNGVFPTAVHVWRYLDGATDSYHLEALTENRFLHFHE